MSSLDDVVEAAVERAVERVLDRRLGPPPPPTLGAEPAYTLAEAARLRSVSVRTLRRGLSEGLAHVGRGRLCRVRLSEVDTWLGRSDPPRDLDAAADELLSRRGSKRRDG